MDGLLIDSEPLWQEATNEIFAIKGLHINQHQYETTIGLRTSEFLQHWFNHFKLDNSLLTSWEEMIVEAVIDKVKTKGVIMNGVDYIFNFFKQNKYKIGLATSSPTSLIDAVIEIAGIKHYLLAIESAQDLPYGKPNPQVYINCAKALKSNPNECICFEDSMNGMIAAKAAKMKCVVVPAPNQAKDLRWSLADLQLSSLQNFGQLHLERLNGE
jgi:sugar-phosphatase